MYMYIILYSGRHPSFIFLCVYTKGFSGVQYIQVGKFHRVGRLHVLGKQCTGR